jgi:hypothetical protein
MPQKGTKDTWHKRLTDPAVRKARFYFCAFLGSDYVLLCELTSAPLCGNI